jgi:type IV pilus assembly protein PilY1
VRWNGNVKKLKLVTVNDPFAAGYDPLKPTFDMIAQNTNPPTPGISQVDGRIFTDALTYWTDPLGADVVAYDPDPLAGEVSGKDGRSITRGGSGQQVTGYLDDGVGEYNGDPAGARQVYTEDPDGSSTNNLLGLDARDTGAATGAMDEIRPYLDPNDVLTEDNERGLIGWIRGLEDVTSNSNADASRPWLMSDPMHSRPLVINYGDSDGDPDTGYTKDNPDIRLFFGTNDGVFHVVRNTSPDGSESGEEGFAFVPLELLPGQAALQANGQQTVEPHIYGLDGEAVSYVIDADGDGNLVSGNGSNDSVMVYIGMRRGGKALYAFNMTDPDAPLLEWKITSEDTDFTQLGMTFSRPFATEIDLDGDGTRTPLLIFAGGYNGGWMKDGSNARIGKDIDGNRAADDIGNAIYVVNAETGALVWKALGPGVDNASDTADSVFRHADMLHSIPSNISLLDTNGNEIVDRGYVGDTGGNIWRIELVEATVDVDNNVIGGPKDWYVTRLADLDSAPVGTPEAGDLRFFHAPDVVQTRDSTGDYDAIVIASGNRADPLDTDVQNYLFMIKDRRTVTRTGLLDLNLKEFSFTDITDVCVSGDETGCANANLLNGWKMELEADGEKGLSKPLTANGIIFMTTYSPYGGLENTCGPSEGSGFAYLMNLNNGSVRFNLDQDADQNRTKTDRFGDIGPGIPGDVIVLDSERLLVPGTGVDAERFDDDPDQDGSCDDQFCRPGGESLWRIYWREEGVDRL